MQDLLKKLPGDLLQRAKCLFSILLDFCVQVICDPNEEELLANLPAKYVINVHLAKMSSMLPYSKFEFELEWGNLFVNFLFLNVNCEAF